MGWGGGGVRVTRFLSRCLDDNNYNWAVRMAWRFLGAFGDTGVLNLSTYGDASE